MKFVVKQIIPNGVKWLAKVGKGFGFVEDIGQRHEFEDLDEAYFFAESLNGKYRVEPVTTELLEPLNLYKLSQDVNRGQGVYESCVVVARSEEEARLIHPVRGTKSVTNWLNQDKSWLLRGQTHLLKVEKLGVAEAHLKLGMVVTSSFKEEVNK